MQTRPYQGKDGLRVWLSRSERDRLLAVYRDDRPTRQLALELALHGLRSDEIAAVSLNHFRPLETDDDYYKLIIPEGKTGKRECPVSADVRQKATIMVNTSNELSPGAPLVDVGTRALRGWMDTAREAVLEADDIDAREREGWAELGLHDCRRSWATDAFYSLAYAGVPIAEELVMSWGGWAMTSSGRETFRENYLGPEPDHVAAQAMRELPLTE